MKTAIYGQSTSAGTSTMNGYQYPYAFLYRREVVSVPLKVVPVPEDIFGPEEKWYRYHLKWYRYPIDSEELVLVPVPVKVVSVPLLPATLNWHILHR